MYPNWEHGGELVELIFDKGFINAIVFAKDKGRFVAVGGLDVGGTGKAAYSDDGVNWIQSGSIAPVGRGCKVTCVAYGAGVFVLADNAGKAAWSEDGVTWTPVDDTTFNDKDDVIQTICYGNGVWVMAGYYGKLAYSIPE